MSLPFGRGSRVEGCKSRVEGKMSRVEGKKSWVRKSEITLRIFFSCVCMDPSRFLAMFNDVLTSVY